MTWSKVSQRSQSLEDVIHLNTHTPPAQRRSSRALADNGDTLEMVSMQRSSVPSKTLQALNLPDAAVRTNPPKAMKHPDRQSEGVEGLWQSPHVDDQGRTHDGGQGIKDITMTHIVEAFAEGKGWRQYLECPITCQLFEDPVIAADGYTYEKKALCDWLSKQNTSPMLGTKMPDLETNNTVTLLPNLALRDLADHVRGCAPAGRPAVAKPIKINAATVVRGTAQVVDEAARDPIVVRRNLVTARNMVSVELLSSAVGFAATSAVAGVYTWRGGPNAMWAAACGFFAFPVAGAFALASRSIYSALMPRAPQEGV